MNSLYVLTAALPAPIIRKILYYTGIGTNTSILIKRKIKYQSRIYENPNWMEKNTFWSEGRVFIPGMLNNNNPLRLTLLLWSELRVLMTIVIKQNGIYLTPLEGLYRQHRKIFKSNHDTKFNSQFTITL